MICFLHVLFQISAHKITLSTSITATMIITIVFRIRDPVAKQVKRKLQKLSASIWVKLPPSTDKHDGIVLGHTQLDIDNKRSVTVVSHSDLIKRVFSSENIHAGYIFIPIAWMVATGPFLSL